MARRCPTSRPTSSSSRAGRAERARIMGRGARGNAAILAGAVALVAAAAWGQRIDPKRPRTLIVGPPRGVAPVERVDAKRTGLAESPLPSGTLRVAWRRNIG